MIVTMGMPAAAYRWFYGAHSVKALRRNILEFAGIRPVRTTLVGGVAGLTPEAVERWCAQLRDLGSQAA